MPFGVQGGVSGKAGGYATNIIRNLRWQIQDHHSSASDGFEHGVGDQKCPDRGVAAVQRDTCVANRRS